MVSRLFVVSTCTAGSTCSSLHSVKVYARAGAHQWYSCMTGLTTVARMRHRVHCKDKTSHTAKPGCQFSAPADQGGKCCPTSQSWMCHTPACDADHLMCFDNLACRAHAHIHTPFVSPPPPYLPLHSPSLFPFPTPFFPCYRWPSVFQWTPPVVGSLCLPRLITGDLGKGTWRKACGGPCHRAVITAPHHRVAHS